MNVEDCLYVPPDMVMKECDAKNEHRRDYIERVLEERDKAEKANSECNTNNDNLTEAESKMDIYHKQKVILKDGYPREVKLWSFISRVTEINTRETSFQVFFTLSASWIETEPKKNILHENIENGQKSWKLANFVWHPQLRFLNSIDEDEGFEDEWFRVVPESSDDKPGISRGSLPEYKQSFTEKYEGNENMRVTHYMKKKLTLAEYFELENFPVDMQSLHIQVSTSWDCHNVLLSFCDKNPSFYEPKALDSQEFELHPPRLISYNHDCNNDDLPLLSSADHSITGVRYSRAYIALTLTRNPMYYILNISFMLTILGSLSFTLFSTKVDDTVDRLGNLFTLVLAMVAYKLVLANNLPAIAYLTKLDIFTMFSIGNQFLIGAGMAIVYSLINDTDKQEYYDDWLLCVTGIFWIGTNLWYYITLRSLHLQRVKKVEEIEKNYEKYKSEIEGDHNTERHVMGYFSRIFRKSERVESNSVNTEDA